MEDRNKEAEAKLNGGDDEDESMEEETSTDSEKSETEKSETEKSEIEKSSNLTETSQSAASKDPG